MKLDAIANHFFKFHKRRQLFIGTHNETLFVVAMCDSRFTMRLAT